jgi:holliday junction DNA helicase RuvA
MIAYLDGKLAYKEASYVLIDVAGVGYEVHTSLQTYSTLPSTNERVKLYTHHHVREDMETLFGFATPDEKALFLDLVSVSGVGPNTALGMLSSMPPAEMRTAIASENVRAVQAIKGIGPKTAQRLILELKDKMRRAGVVADGSPTYRQAGNPVRDEALAALVALGFQKAAAEKSLDTILSRAEGPLSVEDLIRQALR